jgi:hypothetical protein
VHKVGQQRLTSQWRCQKIIIAAMIACLIDGIAQIFANPEAFAYRLFEPPRRRALQGSSIHWRA